MSYGTARVSPASAQLFILSRNTLGNLIISPDSLKENLSHYLSQYRLISDAIDIVDAAIVNFEIDYVITVRSGYRNDQVTQNLNYELKQYFSIENFQIDQPIIISEVENIILNVLGVQSILSLNFANLSTLKNDRIYSNFSYPLSRNIDRGMIFPPRGGIFELKYLDDDIKGSIG